MSIPNDIFGESLNLEPTPLGDEPWGAGRVVVESSHESPGTNRTVSDMFAGVSLDFLIPEEDIVVPSAPTSSMEIQFHSNKAHFQEQTNKTLGTPLLAIDLLKSTSISDFSESSFPKASYIKKYKSLGFDTPRSPRGSSSGPVYTLQQAGRWQQRFMELARFKQEYGHCCVPSHWPQNHSLAQWVKRQRSQRKLKEEGRRSNMTEQREQALTDLGFVWDSHNDVWEERLYELQEYKIRNGHVNVPTRYADNPSLAIWCKRQRRLYKLCQMGGDRFSCISEERIQKLKDLGFDFCPRETEHYRE